MKLLLREILSTPSHREFGCLMAMVSEPHSKNIIKYGKEMVPDNNLYIDPNDPSYGRDTEPHVTSLFGFYPDLTDEQVKGLIKDIKPFYIYATGVSTFKNKDKGYDVVKFDIEPNETLVNLNNACKRFPNQNKYPNYHPHLTIAYVHPNSFPPNIVNKRIPFLVDKFKYSGMNGQKRWYDLKKPLTEMDICDQCFLRAKKI